MRIVLVSHTNFRGNSAMHVFSLAEEFVRLGHDPIMLVPDSPESVSEHRPPAFPIRLYEDALRGDLPFKTGTGAEIVHAWTPREHVRKLTIELAKAQNCPYCVHMEDNEEQILSDENKGMRFAEMATLPDDYLDIIIKPYRTHPVHYGEFLRGAVGYTCLIDRLLEFKPEGIPGAVIWPGFDPEFEHLPAGARGERAKYGISDDEIIVFYSGNVHFSIAEDIRNLYLAVAFFRRRGLNIRLLRTGWDYAPLQLPEDDALSGVSIELGFVDRSLIPTLLGLSDVLVQPGRSDPFNDYRFPSKIPEYLVSGKCVILPDSNIGKCLIDGEQVIKLTEGTLAELIAKMQTVISDRDASARIGARGRDFALNNLRWSAAAKTISDLYRQVLQDHTTPVAATDLAQASAAPKKEPVRVIAFYLPQYHPIQENDAWWGKGFTEWTNVSRARPQLFGHRQPRLPTELGYYDLRVIETMAEQVKLADAYGVGGFCFYHYSFNGRRLLERPVDQWLSSGPNFPFCICWANENWSRRWDGSEQDILLEQTYQGDFAEKFIAEIVPFLKDPRYIRIGGAPLLSVYRVTEFPDPIGTARRFRKAAADHGIPHLHLAMMQSFGLGDPRPFGFDSAIEFSPPHVGRLLLQPEAVGGVGPEFSGYLEDYVGVAAQSINAQPTDYMRFRGCFPMWDNTARRRNKGHIFVNDSPKAYAYWLRFLVEEALVRKDQVEPLIFVNAWNEWAEGAYLEPDEHLGRSLLNLTRLAMLHGFADFLQGRNPERERQFSEAVSVLPKAVP